MSQIFFYGSNNEYICIDCTKSVEFSQNNTINSHSVVSGKQVADDYMIGNKVVQIEGVVTYAKNGRQFAEGNPTPQQFQNFIDSLVDNKTRFELNARQVKNQLLRNINNCVITARNETVDTYIDSLKVSLTLTEVFVSESAKATYLPAIKKKDTASLSSEVKTKGKKKQDEYGMTGAFKARNLIFGEE